MNFITRPLKFIAYITAFVSVLFMLPVLISIFIHGGLIFYDSNRIIVGLEIISVSISIPVLIWEFIKKYRDHDFSEEWR